LLKALDYAWCQEEPQNMGAYSFILPRLESIIPFGKKLAYIGRPAAAAPATGIATSHRAQQQQVIKQCFE
jgi:2-oxoglutarate dehydrogenase complex dehydrogenase (E1) component-like enzyme